MAQRGPGRDPGASIATGIALLVIVVAKFHDGAWITVVLIPRRAHG